MKANLRTAALVAALVAAPLAGGAMAQENVWIGSDGGFGGDDSSFSDDNNWSFLIAPDGTFSRAVIGGDPGLEVDPNPVVEVDGNLSSTPTPQLVLGRGGAYSGTLNVGAGDNLVVGPGTESTAGDVPANLIVGLDGGRGTLNVTGGVLTIGNELSTPSNGAAASAINLSGSASVSAASAFLDKNLTITGGGVSLAISGNAILGQGGTHTWSFGAGGPSAISVGGQLDLGGTLKIDTQGMTPAVGTSYLLADSGSVINGFGAVDVSDVPGISLGVSVRTSTAAGGANGFETSIVFEQQPVLIVNRRTGEVSMQNPGSSATLAFDAYTVGSAAGSLNDSNFLTFAPAEGWQVANKSQTALSELNPLSSGTVAANTTVALGDVFQPAPQAFGVDTDDVTFRFSTPGSNVFTNGVILYEGIPTDTLTLNVDRTTGEAQILNGFREAVTIDTYVIDSASGSLDASLAGWDSLENQSVGGGLWEEAIRDAATLSELAPIGDLTIAASEGVLIGAPYDFDSPSAEEDLVFRFALPNENFFRFGKVVFDDMLTTLPQGGLVGDYNGDGTVDAADYTIWRDNLGQDPSALAANSRAPGASGPIDQGDYVAWRNNYGQTNAAVGAAAGSVPEPASICLAALVFLTTQRRRR
ncbi:hypothetical protein KOR34_46780 [Posidoniimonas corsicana]|uniref:Autotransporter-associated beta strand repeat protein n=1 Tax=Posidoniimonas corsicana TaxID=1938618 RepID=A0A5C5V0M5_9BACT|nr:hypothetical protein [Posidoniimonas corsicana]TWT31302.1 hypothetical protein KOR34_46780 [Posidoniimonas corsicana]